MQQNHVNLVTAIACALLGVSSLIAAELPAEYGRVDYVETQGNQWIDTGYYPGPQTIFEGDVQMVGDYVESDYAAPYGSYNYDTSRTESFCGNFANRPDQFVVWCFRGTQPTSGNHITGTDKINGLRTTLAFNANTKTFTYGSQKLVLSNDIPAETLQVTFGIGGRINPPKDPRPFMNFNMRIYGWKIWTGEKLERDYVPCVRKQDDVAGLYDLQNGVFKPSEGDPFVHARPPVELPAGYALAEYVETRGNQWIDTGYYPGPQTVFEGDVQMVGDYVKSDYAAPYGSYNYDTSRTESFCGNFGNESDTFMIWCFAGVTPSSGNGARGADQINGKRVKLAFNALTKKFTYGTLTHTIGNDIPAETLQVTFGIGGRINPPRDPRPFKNFNMRIYGWKIWTGEKLERDYVPCVREKDNVAGLYDLQNGVFKPSAGDPFIAKGEKIKSVLEFPGKAVTDCITFGYCPSLSSFSASAWVKNVVPGAFESGGTYVGVIFSQGAQGAPPGFACAVASKLDGTYSLNCQVRRSLEDFKSVTTDWTAHAKDGKWHLVTVTYDRSSELCCLYVDAEFKNSITQSTLTPISEQRFCIGARAEGTSTRFPVKGNVAEVSLWDRVLRPTEIKKMLYGQLSGKEAGLLDYWPLTGPYDDLTFKGPVDCVDNGSTRHNGTCGAGIEVISGKVGFRPKPGMALLIY